MISMIYHNHILQQPLSLQERLVCKLLDGINGGSSVTQEQKKTADEITLACLDLLTDLLTRFGTFSYMVTFKF